MPLTRPTDRDLSSLRQAVARLKEGTTHADVVAVIKASPAGQVTVDLSEGMPMVVILLEDLPEPLLGLTPREHEVAALVAEGLANKEIAQQLGISIGTVKDHVHHALSKTGLSNRAALAARLAQRRVE